MDGAELNMLQQLQVLIQGSDIYGNRITRTEQLEAVRLWDDLKNKLLAREISREGSTREAQRLLHDMEVKHREMELEQQRVDVQKAEVIVKALEVGIKGGLKSEHILLAIQGLGESLTGRKLLTSASEVLAAEVVSTAHQLEVKK